MSQTHALQPRWTTGEAVLAAAVLVHLGITALHGFAHARANVALSPAAMAFVFAVIMIGPILGLIAQRLALPRGGAWMIAATLSAALVFGLVNHFLVPGADHVRHVAGPWRALFGVTAALLVASEALGSALAVRCAIRARTQS